MNFKVYYFSGTGNSLWTAKKISENLSGSELLPINYKTMESTEEIDSEGIVIVYPSYAYGLPKMVRKFLQKTKITCSYFAAIVTYGTHYGRSLTEAKVILKRKKVVLNYADGIRCVENYIPIFGAQKPALIEERINSQKEKTETIIKNIQNTVQKKTRGFHPVSNAFSKLFLVFKSILTIFYSVDKKKCTGCAMCRDVCPGAAVKIKKSRPKFKGKKCEQCQACLNICPKKAITFLRMRKKTPRYIHPDINYKELIVK